MDNTTFGIFLNAVGLVINFVAVLIAIAIKNRYATYGWLVALMNQLSILLYRL